MKQVTGKNNQRRRDEVLRNTTHRRKVVIALVLSVVMVALWVKVFVNRARPQSVAAAVDPGLLSDVVETGGLRVVYTELPFVSPRHKVLGNDFFSADNFSRFRKRGESKEVGETDLTDVSDSQHSDGLQVAAKDMKLLAIVNDERAQVFIEGKLLEEGQSFEFNSFGKIYEFKVVKIMDNGVELECDGVTVTKKIPEPFMQAE
ncbi:MAG: hypothetical protein JW806_08015 [Sedimentisphaerales bacterium]|nr:hypothetical protein [Sedimentisphaerales bacterium]